MIKALCFILLSLALVSTNASDFTLDEGVLVLTNDNFQKALDQYKYVLVEFYAPWCGHCQRLAPEYAAAAQKLAESNPDVKLAKVDATENQELGDKFEVQGFPTLKFFKQGAEPMDYTGGRTEPDIVSWLNRRTGSVSQEVKNVEELDENINKSEALALFIGTSSSDQYQHFIKAVEDLDQVVAVNSNDEKVIEKYGGSENTLIVFNSNGQEKHIFDGSASAENFKKFVEDNEFPAVANFNQAAVGRIFQAGRDAVILLKAKNEDGEKAEATFKEVAKELKKDIIFTIANFDEDLGGRVAEFLGVSEGDLPTLRIVQPSQNLQKYKPEGDLTEENLKKFIKDFNAGSLQPFFKSAPLPEEPYEGNVRVLVAKNFEEIVMDKTKDVLVEFYAPWCGHCQSLAPIYESLATNNKVHENLVVAKMDATANEVQGLDIQGFPTIRLYKKDDKENPIEYESDREEKKMVRWLKSKGIIPKDGTEEPTDVDQAFDFGENSLEPNQDHGHDHDHDHAHDHDHDHSHDEPKKVEKDEL